MAMNLKDLNKQIRKKKQAKKKRAKKAPAKEEAPAPDPLAAFGDRIASAIEKVQQPQIVIEPRKPHSWRAKIDLDRAGRMTGATIDPIIE